MEQASKGILAILKKRGYRITNARAAIVVALHRSAAPLTIQDLVAKVKADEASVYRTINILQSEGLIEEIKLPGKSSRYSLKNTHHHHAVCTNCHLVVHLHHDHEPPMPKAVPGFKKIDDHNLTYYGLCVNCSLV